jgi:hypothetical protein
MKLSPLKTAILAEAVLPCQAIPIENTEIYARRHRPGEKWAQNDRDAMSPLTFE